MSERAILSKNTRGAMLCVCEVLSNIVLKPVFYLKKMKKRNKKKKNKKLDTGPQPSGRARDRLMTNKKKPPGSSPADPKLVGALPDAFTGGTTDPPTTPSSERSHGGGRAARTAKGE